MDEPTTLNEMYAEVAVAMLAIMIRDPDAWVRLQATLKSAADYASGEESDLFHSETIVHRH